MFTPNEMGLIGEYLFDGTVTAAGGERRVANTTSRDPAAEGPGAPANGAVGVISEGGWPLQLDPDVPLGFAGQSLNYDVLRESGGPSAVVDGDAQFVGIPDFPSTAELTLECWVKVDYLNEGAYPDRCFGFGACPQPICKDCSYYLFLSTAMSDRNLVFTYIPNGVVQGLPKPAGAAGIFCGSTCGTPGGVAPCGGPDPEDGSGGAVSNDPVVGGVWTHVAATFRDAGAGSYQVRLYINGRPNLTTSLEDACGNVHSFPADTNNPIRPAPGPLRIGMFREVMGGLDYQYSGKICGVRVYDRPLEQAEICADLTRDIGGLGVTPVDDVVFVAVPEGETVAAAQVFELRNPCSNVRLRIIDGPNVDGPPGTPNPFARALGDFVDVEPTGSIDAATEARVWFSYTADAAGDNPTGNARVAVEIDGVATGEEFDVTLTANAVRRPTAIIALALDQSNSMNFDSGVPLLPARKDVLRFSLPPFVELVEDINAVGAVTFDHDPHPLAPLRDMDPGGRALLQADLARYEANPRGNTAIGDGLEAADNLIRPRASAFERRATILLTDGHETADKRIPAVTDLLDEQVFAIGLGTAEQVQPAALERLTSMREGYLLMTGPLAVDDLFRLSKYYLQILAGITNRTVVLDPEGRVRIGEVTRVPFELNEADISADVILLTAAPISLVGFAIETPEGDVVTPSVAAGTAGASFQASGTSSFYRLNLPLPIGRGAGARSGKWHALIGLGKGPQVSPNKGQLSAAAMHESILAKSPILEEIITHGARYSLNVQSYSNLRLRARLTQEHHEPGARLTVRANLTEYRLPVAGRATIRAEVTRPDASATVLSLAEVEPGVFEVVLTASLPGVYRLRLIASGHTLRGSPFRREHLLSGAVWNGGNQPPAGTDTTDPDGPSEKLCELLSCVLSKDVIRPELRDRLIKHGLDIDALSRCIARYCRDGEGPTPSRLTKNLSPATVKALLEALLDDP